MCAPAEMRRTQLSCHAERPVLTSVSFNGVSPQVVGGGHTAAADYLRGHPFAVGTVLSLPEQGK